MIQLKNPRLLIFIITGAVLITVSFIYLVQFNVPEEEVPQPKRIGPIPPTTPLPTTPGSMEGKVIKFRVKGDEFSFSPTTITVARGSRVELMFENIGKVPHNYVIDELDVKTKVIGGGQNEIVMFTAPNTAGVISYASYCSVPGHREAGMEGTIVIE